MRPIAPRASLLAAGLALLAAADIAAASGRAAAPPLLPSYAQECGSCHLAYPPGLLPAASWRRLMAGLDRHFGSDASLDADTARAVTAWLTAHAGRGRAAPDDRITRSAWFREEHHEVAAAPSSAADCAACHRRAAEGSWRENEIRLPR